MTTDISEDILGNMRQCSIHSSNNIIFTKWFLVIFINSSQGDHWISLDLKSSGGFLIKISYFNALVLLVSCHRLWWNLREFMTLSSHILIAQFSHLLFMRLTRFLYLRKVSLDREISVAVYRDNKDYCFN